MRQIAVRFNNANHNRYNANRCCAMARLKLTLAPPFAPESDHFSCNMEHIFPMASKNAQRIIYAVLRACGLENQCVGAEQINPAAGRRHTRLSRHDTHTAHGTRPNKEGVGFRERRTTTHALCAVTAIRLNACVRIMANANARTHRSHACVCVCGVCKVLWTHIRA